MLGLLCSGLKRLPDEVLDGMDLPQAQMLSRYWTKYPHMLFGAGAGPMDALKGTVQAGSPKAYTTKEEVDQLLMQHGPRRQ